MQFAMMCLLSTAAAEIFEMSPIATSELNDVLNMANQLMAEFEAKDTRVVKPQNPCEQDMERLECGSAKCLLASDVSQLSPPCALLVTANKPSLESAPSRTITRFSSDDGVVAETEVFEIHMPEDNEVSILTTISDDNTGAIDFLRDMTLPPPDLAGIFEAFLSNLVPDVRPSAPPAALGSHPCAAEMNQCIREGVSQDRTSMEQCLLVHYEDLSPTCKCFLHEIDDSSQTMAAVKQHTPPAAAAPVVMTVPTVDEVKIELVPPHEPMRHISCMLFMPLMVVAIALLVRRCCLCCYQQKPIFAAVVPPEKATINTVQPLLCVPIAPPLKADEEPVQVPAKA